MTDLSKDTPEPSTAHSPDCEHAQHPQPGTRAWWWFKRVQNASLFVIPCVPLVDAVGSLIRPAVRTGLPDAAEQAVQRAHDFSHLGQVTPSSVVVRLEDPALLDRLLIAMPMLTFAAVLIVVARAVWRIEVNMTGHSRPFTARDAAVYERATSLTVIGWCAVVAWELVLAWRFRSGGFSLDTLVLSTAGDGATLSLLCLALLMPVMAKAYRRGQRAWAELEKGV